MRCGSVSPHRTWFSFRSANSGNQRLSTLAQSDSLMGGPPGTIPAASAGARHFLTVLRSPSEADTCLFERPAYQCTQISTMGELPDR